MILSNAKETLALLLSIKYNYSKNQDFDYANQPRPCHNLVYMLNGEGFINSNGKIIPIKKGDILFIPKNTTYSAKWLANPKISFHSLHFDFQVQNDPLFCKNIPIQKLDKLNFNQSYQLLEEINKYQFSNNEEKFFALSAFYKLLATLLKHAQVDESTSFNKTILPAITYIEQNYAKNFSVEDLANLCFLSQSRFFYLFKKQTGMSPIKYKLLFSIQRASQDLLLDNQSSILQISERHGFSSVIYFERLFKKINKKSPSQYRKENTIL